MHLLPPHIDVSLNLILAFCVTTILSLWIWYKAARNHPTVGMLTLLWFIVQLFAGYFGFYTFIDEHPERIPLLAGPPIILILVLTLHPKMNNWIKGLDLKYLTLIHTVRIPVELCLYYLFVAKAIPVEMTFEGRNFDILAGISAPIMWWISVKRKPMKRKILLWWNVLSLGLLLNIVITAVLSLPLPFQVFGMDQPNMAILYFPFNWLPSVIVPLVMFSHLIAIKRLAFFNEPDYD